MRQAIYHYGDIPASLRNFDQAKAEWEGRTPKDDAYVVR